MVYDPRFPNPSSHKRGYLTRKYFLLRGVGGHVFSIIIGDSPWGIPYSKNELKEDFIKKL
jgi:hypothetical protein